MLLLAGLALLLTGCLQVRGPSPAIPEIVAHKAAGAKRIGSAECFECHEEEDLSRLMRSPHGPLLRASAPSAAGCENCHGPGAKHADSTEPDDIVNPTDFRQFRPEQFAALCLTCHEAERAYWPLSDHARAGITCADCHRKAFPLPHRAAGADENGDDEESEEENGAATLAASNSARPAPLAVSVRHAKIGRSGVCLSCHPAKEAEFRLQFHHPLFEGRVACGDCHNPHGAPPKTRFWRVGNTGCLGCHARQRGPFVWEHQAMDEGCLTCHRPHGSVNQRLLSRPSNHLCLRCHFQSNFPRLGRINHRFLLQGGAQCLDCHLQIHGSNTNRAFSPTF